MADPLRHPKDDVATSLHDAQANLEHVLAHLVRLPAFDPMAIGVATHALSNYLTVMHTGLLLPREAWQACAEARVQTLLQDVEHASDLM